MKNGHLWDSLKPEMKDKAIPENFEYIDEDGSQTVGTLYQYPDGSLSILAVTGGTSSCGTGYCSYTGREVTETNFLEHGTFYADYTLVNGSNDYISNVYDWSIYTGSGGGPYSDVTLTISRSTESLSNDAYAYLRWQADGATHYVKLYVGDDKAWSARSGF